MKRGKKKRKLWLIPVIIIAVLAVVIIGGYALFNSYYRLSHYVKKTDSIPENPNAESMVESTGLTDSEISTISAEAAAASDIELPNDEHVYNLLLVGVDRRDASWYGNSDAMILLSINRDTKTIHMTSFMRDLYANIPGHGVRKLNAACAYGGCPLLVKTIEENYRVNIDNYAWVDFNGMVSIIDAAGGVDIDVTEAEIKYLNSYSKSMCDAAGVDYTQHQVTSAGRQNLDGYEAVGYARIRYVGNSDYQRTERQRTVLTQLMGKMKAMSTGELNSFVQTILPYVTHDIAQSTLIGMITQVPAMLNYDLVTSRVPYDGMFHSQGEILVPDMEATISRLQEEIYGDSSSS